jgi:ribonucleoside-triphosphate reductase
MCCRLRIDNRELRRRGGGLFGSDPLTGSIGVVTINLARIGYLSKSKRGFLSRLKKLMDISKDSLMVKRELLEDLSDRGLYPYSNFYLRNIKARFGKYWKNHFNTIGILGMNEACINHMGKDISTKEGKEFAIEILEFMRKIMKKYQKETKEMFNLEATPGEGTCYRCAKTDKKEYQDIIVANEEAYKNGAAPYYTNSTHLPVGSTDDLFEALDHQDELQTKYTGGTVFHSFLGESLPDGNSAKVLVKKIAENYELPYFSITPTFSICPKHGYISGAHEYCPKCDTEIGYKEDK